MRNVCVASVRECVAENWWIMLAEQRKRLEVRCQYGSKLIVQATVENITVF